MRVSYETIITPNEFGTYEVVCPDLAPHASWQAQDIASAAGVGAYVVAAEVHRCIERGVALPVPTLGMRAGRGGCVLSVALDIELVRMPFPDCCTVNEAARILNVSTSRVRALARTGRLKSNKYGNLWFISLESLNERVANPCRPGRPRKDRAGEGLPAA